MIPTDNNKKAENLEATRTFSVSAHTAESLKGRINQANKQNLRYRSAENPGSAPHSAGQRDSGAPNPARPAAITPAQAAHRTDERNDARMQAANPARPAHPAQAANNANAVHAARASDPAAVRQKQIPQAPANHPVTEAQTARPAIPANHPVTEAQTARPAVPQTQAIRPAADAARQAADAPRQAADASRQAADIARQQKAPEVRPTALPAVRQSAPSLPVQENRRQTLPEAAVPAESPAVPEQPTDVSGILKRSEELNELEKAQTQMEKTRQMKLKAASAGAEKSKKKKKEKVVYESDEGGNTVVSVVKAIVYIIFVVIVSVFLAVVTISVGNDVFAFVKSDEATEIEIPDFATLDEVADILYQNDIIRYPKVFKAYAVFKEDDQDYLAGTYTVNGMMNYDTLLDEFKEKPVTGTVRLTIPEGYTVDEIINLFVSNGIGTREEFVRIIQEEEFNYWFVKELEANGIPEGRIYRLEGYLFPDTYEFYKSSSEYTVINKMLKRFAQIFTKDYRTQCEQLGYTVDQMITLASLIEKEAGSVNEFYDVSSVFHNRIGNPWGFPRLESDATVAYILQHENNGERVAVKASDLYMDNPYNTYQNNGLTPGPIANPSASAILAALSPKATPYYYFVANAGKTYFSATRAEHEAYIAQFKDPSYVAAIPKAEIPGEEISGGVPLTQQENWQLPVLDQDKAEGEAADTGAAEGVPTAETGAESTTPFDTTPVDATQTDTTQAETTAPAESQQTWWTPETDQTQWWTPDSGSADAAQDNWSSGDWDNGGSDNSGWDNGESYSGWTAPEETGSSSGGDSGSSDWFTTDDWYYTP